MIRLSVSLCLFFLLAAPCPGAVIYVPDDYTTVQGAVDAAGNGDEIIVRPGTYAENIDFLGKAVTVASEQGPEVTVLDGNQAGSVVTFRSGETSLTVIEGFTITNGSGTPVTNSVSGGGILCGPASSPTIRGNIIRDNSCWNGGGIHNYDHSAPVITNNTFSNNVCKNGGAINNALNSAPVITDNVITGNSAPVLGGGIACHNGCDALIENNIITDNQAHAGRGGGIYCYATGATIRGNTIARNLSGAGGGGIYCKACSPVIEHNTIHNNTCTGGNGGGVECSIHADPTIAGNVIYGNSALHGAGINCFSHSSPTIYSNIIVRNSASSAGGGINCLEFCGPAIVNCTLVDNTGAKGGGGLSIFRKSSSLAANLVIWGNHSPVGSSIIVGEPGFPSTLLISHSDVQDGPTAIRVNSGSVLQMGDGMLDTDPLFADITGGDFHLTRTSPCRNAGENSAVLGATDFEGDKRIAHGTVDMGADETCTRLYVIGRILPGSAIEVKVVGMPGLPAWLALGSGIQDPPQSTPHGDLWLTLPLLKSWKIGVVPGDGVLSFAVTVPAGWLPGEERFFQAWVGAWGGSYTKLTNLMILTVE